MKLTPELFLQQYTESGKKHMLITGDRGKGKTTLFRKIVSLLAQNGETLPGLTSVYIPKTGVMLKDNITGTEAAVGIYCPQKAEIGKNMIPHSDGFFTVGIPSLEAVKKSKTEWFTIDEIGFLESNELQFQQTLLKTMERKKLIAIVRKTQKGAVPFIDEMLSHSDTFVIDLDNYNNSEYWD